MAFRPGTEDGSEPERRSGNSEPPEASKLDEAADDSMPSSELDSQWQLAGDSDHEHDSGYSDLGSELDRASSPDPTLDALRFTSRQHGLAASSHLPADLAQVQTPHDALPSAATMWGSGDSALSGLRSCCTCMLCALFQELVAIHACEPAERSLNATGAHRQR